jgi:hypothetical protein
VQLELLQGANGAGVVGSAVLTETVHGKAHTAKRFGYVAVIPLGAPPIKEYHVHLGDAMDPVHEHGALQQVYGSRAQMKIKG